MHTASFLINRMPSTILHYKSPFELLFGKIPSVSHLRIFGCACFPLLHPYLQNKLQPKTHLCVFLGYASQSKGYLCYNISSKRLYVSRHVVFNENVFPYKDLVIPTVSSPPLSHCTSPSVFPIVTNDNVISLPPISSPSSSAISSHLSSSMSIMPAPLSLSSIPVAPASIAEGMNIESSSSKEPFRPENLSVAHNIPSMNIHSMQTRSKSGIV